MVRISILYPAKTGARFDMDYYINVHVPLALDRLGPAIKSFNVDVATDAPSWPKPAFIAMAHYLCDSREAFETAYGPHAQFLQSDVANYTDIEPITQISDARFSR